MLKPIKYLPTTLLTGEKVNVITDPDGQILFIPDSKLEKIKKLGYFEGMLESR